MVEYRRLREGERMMEQERLDQYKYLVRLRNSGATNMFGAAPYLEAAYDLGRRESGKILVAWMESFSLPDAEQPDDGR